MPKPLILYSALSGRYYVSTRYTVKETHIVTHTKTDVTDQMVTILEPHKQRRDALLEACKATESELRWIQATVPDGEIRDAVVIALEKTRSAIAKAEGKDV